MSDSDREISLDDVREVTMHAHKDFVRRLARFIEGRLGHKPDEEARWLLDNGFLIFEGDVPEGIGNYTTKLINVK